LGLTEQHLNLSGEAKIEVYIDEKISETYTFTGGNMPKNIELKLKGANKIGFKVSKKDSTSENVEIGLFDAR
ncbi:hypothetical protein, partial [Lysinibacillus sp. D4A3_S15]|uniref:hypothetical protein n=1 Tax=Lysinibacillus sp. D4A3_S15 TaxID=2941227 RepID=UPI0020BE2967